MPGYGGKGGQGKGMGKKGRGGGLRGGGNCVCVKCGYSAPQKAGTPCMQEKCPHCGAVLLREGGMHYNKAVKNKTV